MLKKEVKEYLSELFDNDLNKLFEFNSSQLTFSFLMGMCPKECEGMYPEEEWTSDQIREYDEIEDVINNWKREIQRYNK